MPKNTVREMDIPQPRAKKNDSLVDIVSIVLVLYVWCMFNCWVLSLFKVQSNGCLFPPENAKTIFCSTPFSFSSSVTIGLHTLPCSQFKPYHVVLRNANSPRCCLCVWMWMCKESHKRRCSVPI